eukprot:TRINITY_DN64172_c0_g1_i1.p1 TRINITY_DN64172_c0_g1~~TRINITY_DN64172_c0_g1_i1.p1  ORF type:complete len:449 (-),score=74.21 TRINITY_DN64172_c0_g1_i1:369-1715(-)
MMRCWLTALGLSMAAAVVSGEAGGCSSDNECFARCKLAIAGMSSVTEEACDAVTCDAESARCSCSSNASSFVLRREGWCESMVEQSIDVATKIRCEREGASHQVLMHVATITPVHVHRLGSNDTSTELSNTSELGIIFQRSLEAALHMKAGQVALWRAQLRDHRDGVQNGNSSLPVPTRGLQRFDLAFGICAEEGSVVTAEEDIRGFEFEFARHAQEYAVFSLATLRVLSLKRVGASASEHGMPSQAESPPAQPQAVEADGARVRTLVWLGLPIGAFTICLVLTAFLRSSALLLVTRWQSVGQDKVSKVTHGSSSVLPTLDDCSAVASSSASALRSLASTTILVCATHPFKPTPTDADASAWESCLDLQEGDCMEVSFSDGEWVYGHIVGQPERLGFFPQSHIMWVGRMIEEKKDIDLDVPVVDAIAQPDLPGMVHTKSDEWSEVDLV